MGFYGNITNTSRTQFQFDKIYSNRTVMDASVDGDGIYLGRYVLIEYDQQLGQDWSTVVYQITDEEGILRFYTSIEGEAKTEIIFGEGNIQAGKYLRVPGKREGENGTEVIYNLDNPEQINDILYQINGLDETNNISVTSISELGNPYNENYNLDIKNYGPGRGFDSTVWQKVYVSEETKYVMIAELNTIVPTFGISPDAPTMSPITPHFGVDSSNVYYKLHWQPGWGLRVKSAYPEVRIREGINYLDLTTSTEKIPSDEKTVWSYYKYDLQQDKTHELFYNYTSSNTIGGILEGAWVEIEKEETTSIPAAIYYNKAGFDPNIITYSDENIVDSIKVEPTGLSGNKYNAHNGVAGATSAQVDTQELSIILPSIGNTIAKVWDLLYGDEIINKSNERNLYIAWQEGSTLPNRRGLRLVQDHTSGYNFNEDQVNTLAGAINSVQDLMGMIIQKKENKNDFEQWPKDYIYYLKEDQKFYQKHKNYVYEESNKSGYSQVSFDDKTIWPENGKHENYYIDGNDYILRKDVRYDDRTYYKAPNVKNAITEFSQDYEPNKYFTMKTVVEEDNISYTQYTQAVEKEPVKGTIYFDVQYTSLGDNLRFWTKNTFYVMNNFQQFTASEAKASNFSFFFKGEIKNNSKILTRISKNSIDEEDEEHYFIGVDSFKKDDGEDFNEDTYYFEVSQTTGDDDDAEAIYVETITYKVIEFTEKEPYEKNKYYIKKGDVYILFSGEYNGEYTYYKKVIELILLENDKQFPMEAFNPVQLKRFDNNTNYCYIEKINNIIYINVIENTRVLEKHPNWTSLWEISNSTPLTDIYFPDEYYYVVPEKEVYEGSYILGTELRPYSGYTYYAKKDVTIDIENPVNNYLLSYSPATYYYLDDNGEYILDNNNEPSSNRTYYKINDLYVIEDTTGNFAPGAKWNSNVTNVDEGITLGTREEVWELQELKGFARNYNTIHGLILRINQMLEADNLLTRDLKTVQGSINTLNDIIRLFGNLSPEKIAVTDKYGRITTTGLDGDEWIKPIYDEGHNIIITHENKGELNGGIIKVDAPETAIIPFGGTFTSPNFTIEIDNAGHVDKYTTSNNEITLPHLEYTVKGEGNLVIDMEMSEGSGETTVTFTETRKNVGTLELTEYVEPAENVTGIVATDTINGAFKKIDEVLGGYDETVTADTNNYIFEVKQTNGKLSASTRPTTDITSLGTVTVGTWNSAIAEGRVTTLSILNSAVTTDKISNSAVTTEKINNLAVTTEKINDLAVDAGKIKNSAVTTEKIADGGITEVKLANLVVTTGKIAEGAVTTNKINSSAITTDLINNSAVTLDKIATNAINADKIIDSAITSSKIASLEASKIIGTLTIDNIPSLNMDKITEGKLVGSRVALTEYVISEVGGQSVSVDDTVNEAIAKLEKRIADLETRVQTLEGTNPTT